MKDRFGHERGACNSCNKCTAFVYQESSARCSRCNCKPIHHEKLPSLAADNSSTGNGQESTYDSTKLISVQIFQGSQCSYPGCLREVLFDVNTGRELLFCSVHEEQPADKVKEMEHSGVIVVDNINIEDDTELEHSDVIVVDDIEDDTEFWTEGEDEVSFARTTADLTMVESTQQLCAIQECQKPCYVDESGTVHKCCGITHAREFQRRMEQQGQGVIIEPPTEALMLPTHLCSIPECHRPCHVEEDGTVHEFCGYTHAMEYQRRATQQQVAGSTRLCAIQECQNPCHVDENGVVHECCGYTHAMEHQRRQAMQQATDGNIIKGVTHCLLPECNSPTWPFENYCGRSHANVGKQRGLIPPNTVTADKSDADVCIFPNCKSLKFIESDGKIHPYCGQTHANLAKQLGIFATTSEPQDQCELEGCIRLRYREGTRIHNYCCKEHAEKDAPNRAKILTSNDEVQKWLKQFKNLTVVSLDENQHAKPEGVLFKKFRNKMMTLPKDQRKTCLAFHGTSANNIQSICQNGYDPTKRCGQAYGAGEYFAKTPDVSLQYCKGGKKMLLNELLLGQSGKHHTQHGDIIVMKEPVHDLPRFVITFK